MQGISGELHGRAWPAKEARWPRSSRRARRRAGPWQTAQAAGMTLPARRTSSGIGPRATCVRSGVRYQSFVCRWWVVQGTLGDGIRSFSPKGCRQPSANEKTKKTMKCCMYVDLSLYRGRTSPSAGGTPAYHACTAPTAPLPGRRRNGHSLDSVYPSRSRDPSVRVQLFSTSDMVRTDVVASKPVPAAGELGGHVRCQSIYKGARIARRIGLLAWLCLRGLSGICRPHGMGSWWVLSRRQCGDRKGVIPVLRRQLRAGVRLLIPQRRRRHALRRPFGMVAAHGAAGQVPRKAPAAAAAARGVGFLGPTTRGTPRRCNARGRAARRQS